MDQLTDLKAQVALESKRKHDARIYAIEQLIQTNQLDESIRSIDSLVSDGLDEHQRHRVSRINAQLESTTEQLRARGFDEAIRPLEVLPLKSCNDLP